MSSYSENSLGLSDSDQDLWQSSCVFLRDNELSATATDASLISLTSSSSITSLDSQLDATPFEMIKEYQLGPGTKSSHQASPEFSILISNVDQLTNKL